MKIRRILSVFLLTVLMVSLMLTPQAYALPALEIKAKAAVLVDADEGRIIFGQNEQEREYPASITKVMTALLTLEAVDAGKLSLDQPITASAVVNDQDPEGSSAGIEEGEVLTVEQLLYCLLLVSANEAADILAETVSGSREAFVELMNQRAQELGCTGTHFANTNGLHDVNHYTTAYDIYLFFREAMKHETFMTITGSVAYEVPATNKSEARELHTTNSLLSNWRILDYLYDGVDCGKTGSTPEAGYCLVSSCLRDGKRLVAVVLGAEGEGTHIESFSESARLYNYGYDNFSKQLVVSTEDVFRQPVALSKETDCVMLYPAENAEAFLPSDVTKDQLEQTVTLKNEVADAPITRGQEMGTLTISYNGQVCVTVPLLAQADVSASRFLVAKAAVETVAENASDGVIAPLIFLALGGAPLGMLYKAVNTMDSMIGYRNERYQYFGTAAAKLDDILNYIPARISAYLMILAAFFARYDAKEAFRVYRRDKRNHASPNSAHTEAVCAGALHIQLAGDAYYFGKLHKKPTIGNADRPIEAKDICRANHLLYITTCIAIVVGLGLKSLLFLCFI